MATSVTSTSGAIHFTGLGNGTDFDSMITQLVDVEGQRVTTLETWKATWDAKVEYFQLLNSQLLTLKSSLSKMDTVGSFLTKAVAVGDSGLLSATAGADAEEGTHTVEVNQIAQTTMLVTSSGYASEDTSINSTGGDLTFTYSYGKDSTEVSVTIPDDSTITDFVNIINTDSSNPGVKAALLYDGTEYFLQLRGMDTGADEGALSIVDASTSDALNLETANFDVVQSSQDAQIIVDGWPNDGSYIERATNTISDVITGVTLNLKDYNPGEVISLNVSTDYDAVVENVATFVDQVNAVRTLILKMTEFDSTTEEGSLLTGNYGVQLISTQLKTGVSDKPPGFDYDNDVYTSLSQVGILTVSDENASNAGLLAIDEDVLLEKLKDDPDAFAELFAAEGIGSTDSADISFESSITSVTEAGEYNFEYEVDASGDIISASVDGVAINSSFINNTKHTITVDDGNAAGLEISVNNLNTGTYSHTVYLKQGKTGELIDKLEELTNETTGPLAILEDNYKDIMDSIDDKIEYEERRITQLETRLRERYANLDSLLGTYSETQTQLTSLINQLSD